MDNYIEENETRRCIITCTKINSKWIKDLHVRHETIKLLEENICKNLLNISMSNFFPGRISLGKRNKNKNEHVDYIKLKSFCTANNTINRTKRHPTVWENIFINDRSDKGVNIQSI